MHARNCHLRSPFLRRPAPARLATLALLAVAALAAPPLAATHYLVDSLADEVTTDGNCTLREAVSAAVTNAPYDGCPAGTTDDLVTLPAGTVLWDGGRQVILGAIGTVTIEGPTFDRADAVVDCNHAGPFLAISNMELTLRNFSVTNCDAAADSGAAMKSNTSSLTLDNVAFTGNSSATRGGAVDFTSDEELQARQLVVERCRFENNSATDQIVDPRGGALFAQLRWGSSARIVRTELVGNSLVSTARPSEGGGIAIEASHSAQVALRELFFDENRCAATDTGQRGCGLALELSGNAQGVVSGARFADNYAVSLGNYIEQNGASFFAYGSATLLAERIAFLHNVNLGNNSVSQVQVGLDFRDNSSALVRDVLAVGGNTGVYALAQYGTPLVRLDHLTVADNSVGALLVAGATGTLWLQSSILFGNGNDLDIGGSISTAGSHVGDPDPLFADPNSGDFRLSADSLDLDKIGELEGVGKYDLEHAPRLVGDLYDRGAYERGGIFGDDFESGDTSAWPPPL